MVEKQTKRLLEGHHLAEDNARYADVEVASRGLRPTTAHYSCTMMMMMMMKILATFPSESSYPATE